MKIFHSPIKLAAVGAVILVAASAYVIISFGFDQPINHSSNTKVEAVQAIEEIVAIEPLTVVDSRLSVEQQKEYDKWIQKGESHIGIYKRKLQEISGELSANAKRITLDEAKLIIANKDSKTAIEEIEKLHGPVDFEGGSGVTFKELWLDAEGKQKLNIIVEQAQIYYIDGDKTQLLKG